MSKKETILGIGWDVGGWMGKKQAVAAAKWSPDEAFLSWLAGTDEVPCVSDSFSLAQAGGFDLTNLMSQLYSEVELNDYSRIVVAIDAPLGFPEHFVEFVRDPRPLDSLPTRDIENPLAYRFTERWIEKEYRKHKKKPLSPSFQSLTSNATVALSAISLMRQRHGFKLVPQDGDVPTERSIIEVYPALVKKGGSATGAFNWIEEMISLQTTAPGHSYDASICAIYAILFAATGRLQDFPELVPPPEDHSEIRTEGWIYSLPWDFVESERAKEELLLSQTII